MAAQAFREHDTLLRWRSCSGGADVNELKMDGSKATALYIASQEGHEGVVQLLLERGAVVDCEMDDGWTPLFQACWLGHEGVVRRLLEHGGASVNHPEQESGSSPLYVACEEGHLMSVRVLLERGAAVDQSRDDGAWSLLIASLDGREGVVQLLLEYGAAVNHADEPNRVTARSVRTRPRGYSTAIA
eukprot:2608013-Prymnesium_polylepis.2